MFLSQQGKVNKITQLTEEVNRSENDIECLGLLHKIVVIQLNQAAIQFFKRDKFTTYNHTVNLYSQKQIENNQVKKRLFQLINQANEETQRRVLGESEEETKQPVLQTIRSNPPVQSIALEQQPVMIKAKSAMVDEIVHVQGNDSGDDELLGILKQNGLD